MKYYAVCKVKSQTEPLVIVIKGKTEEEAKERLPLYQFDELLYVTDKVPCFTAKPSYYGGSSGVHSSERTRTTKRATVLV